jgi:hypothetical protein
VVVALFASFHLYKAFRHTPADEFRKIILPIALGLVALMLFSF